MARLPTTGANQSLFRRPIELPGLAVAFLGYLTLLHGADWQGGELWAHRHAVAFWSGLFWLAASLAAALPIYFVTEKQHPQAALTSCAPLPR